MTTLETITIIISIASAIIIPITIVGYTSYSNKKLQNDRIEFEKELSIKQDKRNEEILKMQTQLDNINKKLELEQQFLIEKKKYMFQIKINAIDEFIEDLTELELYMTNFTNEDNISLKIEKIEKFQLYMSKLGKSHAKAATYIGDDNLSKYIELVIIIGSVHKDYIDGKGLESNTVYILGKKLGYFIKSLNSKKEEFCNEGLEIKKE